MEHLNTINECNDVVKMDERLEKLSANMPENETVMYIIINGDLKMEKGKTAGQCCHSACRVTRVIEKLDNYTAAYKHWINNFEPKIILKASKEELEEISKKYAIVDIKDTSKDLWCVYTRDIGRTQIERGSLTSVAFCPIFRKEVPDFIKKLKLC